MPRSNPCDAEDRDRYSYPSRNLERSWISDHSPERTKVTKAIGSTLQKTAIKIITIVNRNKDHIPPITTSETNPFPYHIDLNPRVEGWGKSMGIF